MEQRAFISDAISRHGYDEHFVKLTIRTHERIEFMRDGCWAWTGTLNSSGYGLGPRSVKGAWAGFSQLAHRLVYELIHEDIPEGLDLDHLCRNRPCVRPDHLEPVDRQENVQRIYKAKYGDIHPPTCLNGHPFTDENRVENGAWTRCRVCLSETKRVDDGERERASKYGRPDKCEAGLHDYIPENRKQNGAGTKCRLCHNAYMRNRYRQQKRKIEEVE